MLAARASTGVDARSAKTARWQCVSGKLIFPFCVLTARARFPTLDGAEVRRRLPGKSSASCASEPARKAWREGAKGFRVMDVVGAVQLPLPFADQGQTVLSCSSLATAGPHSLVGSLESAFLCVSASSARRIVFRYCFHRAEGLPYQ